MIKLTARQQEILDLIKRTVDETGFPPTRAEIAQELGFKSANAAEEHLKALARKGAIEMTPGASRGIKIPDHHTGLPIVGRVAAGEPILAEQNIEEYVDIPQAMFHPAADYLLEVHGDSMKNVGIMNGDLLAVHRANTARNGQIIVARVNDEVTVKRYKLNKNIVYLLAENDDYEPITVDLREDFFEIEGHYVGVIRRYH